MLALKKLKLLEVGIFLFSITLLVVLSGPGAVFAQGMMGQYRNQDIQYTADPATEKEEAEGKGIYDKLQAKQVRCIDLKESDYDVLGEYFMGQRVGTAHAAMNTMMKQMMGEAGETQMHVSLGKRLSGCDTGAPYPTQGAGFLPMMGMMGDWNNNSFGRGGWSMMGGNWGQGMMGGGIGGWGLIGGFIWILVIIFLVLGIVYFWKGITGKGRK